MTFWLWAGFIALVVGLLALDLGVFNKRPHAITVKEALGWSAFWIALGMLFIGAIYFIYEHHWLGMGTDPALTGKEAALEYFTGYIIEKSLSLDNIFVIALIFSYFGVPLKYQHRTLFWGIFGALVMRGVMIGIGAELLHRFIWMEYVFGGILLITAARMLVAGNHTPHPDTNPMVRLARRFYKVKPGFDGPHFFTTLDGKRAITPLFLALMMIETADLVFAVDSIPAIFGITKEPFIVFTSNVFAILGLRSLYFALAGALEQLRYLKFALVVVLAFVGLKMLTAAYYHISTPVSLGIIMAVLAVGVITSVIRNRFERAFESSDLADDLWEFALNTYRRARRVVIIVTGVTVALIGIVLLALPGPGLVVMGVGLGLLATEFIWARRLLAMVRKKAKELGQEINARFK